MIFQINRRQRLNGNNMDQLSKSFLIVANGEFLPKKQLLLLSQDKVIVALDHASERLLKINIVPDIIVGDFDSIHDKKRFKIDTITNRNMDAIFKVHLNDKIIQMIYRPKQDETDFFKAIRYIDILGSRSIHIACVLTKNRLDHLINNLRALRAFYQKSRPLYLYTSEEVACYLKNETLEISGQIGSICGIFGFPKGSFSSTGLKYNGDHFPLTFGFSESVANEFASEKVTIAIEGEALFIKAISKNSLP